MDNMGVPPPPLFLKTAQVKAAHNCSIPAAPYAVQHATGLKSDMMFCTAVSSSMQPHACSEHPVNKGLVLFTSV